MEWLNYHHLLYFYTVAREGGVAKAARALRLAEPTVSSQIHALEDALGETLFTRSGRSLVLTEAGQLAYRYAEDIFSLGRELRWALKGRPTGRQPRLTVGIADAVPKLISYRLLQPALSGAGPVRLVCREDRPERLLADLSLHELDVVISDAPVDPGLKIKAYSHLLGESSISIFGSAALKARWGQNGTAAMHGAPFLLPGLGTSLRRAVDYWLDATGLSVSVVGEFEDSGLLKAFGQAGAGLFFASSVIAPEINRQYEVEEVLRLPSIRERYYVITPERKLKDPVVLAISDTARTRLFSSA